jgi:hypothetical protein
MVLVWLGSAYIQANSEGGVGSYLSCKTCKYILDKLVPENTFEVPWYGFSDLKLMRVFRFEIDVGFLVRNCRCHNTGFFEKNCG